MAHRFEINASAPGTLMLLGEHAVLHGSKALVLAVDKRIRVRLQPLATAEVQIESALGRYQSPLAVLRDDAKFSFVLAAISHLKPRLSGGFSLSIESDFSHKVGLGSSAAVTVAVLAALNSWLDKEGLAPSVDKQALFEQARAVMLTVQGRGSGADLAAAIEGGLVEYQLSGERRKFAPIPEIGLYFCGYKLKTPEVLRRVALAQQQQPALYDGLYRLMGQCAEQASSASEAGDWPQLGRLMNIYQGLMDALGVNDATLSQMIYSLRQNGSVQGAKISGSGLGDCVIALGLPSSADGLDPIPVQVSPRGVEVH